MAQTSRRKKSEGSSHAVVALLTGGSLSLALVSLMLMLLSGALCSGRLEETTVLRLCPAAVGLGSLAGGMLAAHRLGERFLPAAVGAAVLGAILWMLLGIFALDGISPTGALHLLLPTLIGGTLAGIVCAH